MQRDFSVDRFHRRAFHRRTFAMTASIACAAALHPWSIASAGENAITKCQRKFDDRQIDAILVAKLHYRGKHRTQVNWQNCRYYAVMWPDHGAPDTETIMDLDADGNLPPEVAESGIHSDISLEGTSLRSYTLPAYPREARERNVTGTVYTHLWIGKDGTVSRVAIEKTLPPSATALTVGLADAIRKWLFNPRTVYGNPVESELIVPFKFSIGNSTVPLAADAVPQVPNTPLFDTIDVGG